MNYDPDAIAAAQEKRHNRNLVRGCLTVLVIMLILTLIMTILAV